MRYTLSRSIRYVNDCFEDLLLSRAQPTVGVQASLAFNSLCFVEIVGLCAFLTGLYQVDNQEDCRCFPCHTAKCLYLLDAHVCAAAVQGDWVGDALFLPGVSNVDWPYHCGSVVAKQTGHSPALGVNPRVARCASDDERGDCGVFFVGGSSDLYPLANGADRVSTAISFTWTNSRSRCAVQELLGRVKVWRQRLLLDHQRSRRPFYLLPSGGGCRFDWDDRVGSVVSDAVRGG